MFQFRFVLTALAVLAIGMLVIACGSSGGTTIGNATLVNVTADATGCKPTTIETIQGAILQITLKNTANAAVSFVFKDGPFTLTAPAGGTAQSSFTVPTQTGRYDFQCMLAGNSVPISLGTIQVKTNP